MFTGGFFVTLLIIAGHEAGGVANVAGLAMAAGALCWPLYGPLYDGGMRRRLHRLLSEQTGDRKSWLCEVALRPDGVWSRSRGVETLTGWDEVTAIEDTPGAVELHCRNSFVIVRDRAFASSSQRAMFLEASKSFAETESTGREIPTPSV